MKCECGKGLLECSLMAWGAATVCGVFAVASAVVLQPAQAGCWVLMVIAWIVVAREIDSSKT